MTARTAEVDCPAWSRRRDRSRGFTLIEVLAALVIVALGMLGVIEAVTLTARNGTYLRDKTLAHWIAMNLVTERRLRPELPPVAESSDEVEFAGQRWRWTLKVTPTQVESLRRMDVSVRPAGADESSSLATVTGFYGTAIGAAGGGTIRWQGTQRAGGKPDPNAPGDGEVKDEGDGGWGGNKNPKDPEQPEDPPPTEAEE